MAVAVTAPMAVVVEDDTSSRVTTHDRPQVTNFLRIFPQD